MCDTQVLIADNGIWFAKNSDREPQEPQAVVRIPAIHGDTATHVQTTYVSVPQVPNRFAVILSKPCWIWGAEMGVNDQGLAIGNEAIFSKQRSLKPALLGMDLLRLGLERAATAQDAITVITDLLGRHGQGGPAGHADKSFHYDSSFILADRTEAWVLETAGKEWAAQRVRSFAAISNALSLEQTPDRASAHAGANFRANDTRFLPFFAGSHRRRDLSLQCLAKTQAQGAASFAQLASHLRQHRNGNEAPLEGSNADVCMHAAGPIRRSQTTGSMIAHLSPDQMRVMVTGTSSPCLSLFRPVDFQSSLHVFAPNGDQAPLWNQWQSLQASALFHPGFRRQVRARIANHEAEWCAKYDRGQHSAEELDADVKAVSDEMLGWQRPAVPFGLTTAHRIWRQTQ